MACPNCGCKTDEIDRLRTALREERDWFEARYMTLLKAVADGRAMQPAPPILVSLWGLTELRGNDRHAQS